MRDHHDRAPPRHQVLRQPADALDVEVVGGLVQHHQVEITDQRAGQRHSALLPAGEPVDDPVEVVEAEPVQHVAHLRIGGPLVLGPVRVQDDVAYPRAARQVIALRQMREPQPADPAHPPRVGRPRAGEDVQQRRLAATVEADDADAVARLHAERNAVEQHP